MGLKSIPIGLFYFIILFAPYMGLKSVSAFSVEILASFAPYMGLKRKYSNFAPLNTRLPHTWGLKDYLTIPKSQ